MNLCKPNEADGTCKPKTLRVFFGLSALSNLRRAVCGVCFVCFVFAQPQFLYADGGLYLFPKGAKAEGTGKSGILNTDVWSVYNNQAALAFVNEVNAGVNYEDKFGINQLGISSGAFALPALSGTFGFDVAHTGIEDYGETRIGAGYGKKLSKNLALGVHFNYHLMSFNSGYPNLYTFTGEIGLIAEPIERLLIGAHVFNPTFAKLNSKSEIPVPVIFSMGVGYKMDNLFLVSEFTKEQTNDVIPHLGVEYAMFTNMTFRAGACLKPVELCFGVGWTIKSIQLDFAVSRHATLGYSPQIGLSYKFLKK